MRQQRGSWRGQRPRLCDAECVLGKGQEMFQTGLAKTQEWDGGPGLDGILSRRGQGQPRELTGSASLFPVHSRKQFTVRTSWTSSASPR